MNIVEAYPYAIVGYSLFVTAFAVYLWKLTNRNVDATRDGIQTQVKQAINNLTGIVNSRFESMSNAVNARLDAIPPVDFAALDTRLDELADGIPTMDDIRETLNAQLRAFESAQVRQVQAEIQTLGLPAVIDEAKQQMQAQLPQAAIQAQRFMNRKVSARFAEEHPFETAFIDMGKVGMAQLLESMYAQGGVMQGNAPATVNTGFGVR